MGLYTDLQKATSEEDVKQAYIKHLQLDKYASKTDSQLSLGLVDIKTNKMWFEAKDKATNPITMFTQLIYYVKKAKEKGDYIPPFLSVIDPTQAAILETSRVLDWVEDKSIKWGKSASDVTADALEKVSAHIHTHYVVYQLQDYENEFMDAVKQAFLSGKMLRQAINSNNLRIVFDNWVEEIGKEIELPKHLNANGNSKLSPEDYALFFYADIMNDGGVSTYNDLSAQLIRVNNNDAFMLNGVVYPLSSVTGYQKFWSVYNRPPAKEERSYLLERRDSLIPLDIQKFKGAFYTPLHVVQKAYDYLNATLGKNWQKDYIVWDMCCGVGNLQVKHSNYHNIFMSTLDNADIEMIKATKTCVGATVFQYDYLNDDIAPNGTIDYTLTNKIPAPLQELLTKGTMGGVKKKLLILINPPYAEATSADTVSSGTNKNKTGVAKSTLVAQYLMSTDSNTDYGKSTNELFTQFVARIMAETTKLNTHLAMFSKLKYVNAPNFAKFRDHFKAQFKNGFIVHSKAFDGLAGNFPIGFLIWNLAKKQQLEAITCDVLTKTALNIGSKSFYNLPNNTFLNVWIDRPKANSQFAVPLSNALAGSKGKIYLDKWSDNALAYFVSSGNDFQNAVKFTYLLSSVANRGHGMYITPQNLLQASVVFAVRQVVTHTWINDRDQFLQPNINLTPTNKNIYNIKTFEGAFVSNCLVYMLFSGSNLTASSNKIEYNGTNHTIVNHFIPFTEIEVNANSRFESTFLTDFLTQHKIKFTPEGQNVLDSAKAIYQLYFSLSFNSKLKQQFHLYNSSVGWYQIRKSLEEYGKQDPQVQIQFTQLYNAYKLHYQNLTDIILPQVYDVNPASENGTGFGFLKK